MPKQVLCLMSGGIDSTVLAQHYINKGWRVTGIFFKYGQPNYELEYTKVGEVGRRLNVPILHQHFRDNLPRDGYFYPMRNALLLCWSISEAYNLGVPAVAIGCNTGEYLDQRPEFIDRFNFMVDYCLQKPIYVLAPFANWSSERVIKYGLKIGAPLHLTISCMDVPPCGTCLKCKLRRKYGID